VGQVHRVAADRRWIVRECTGADPALLAAVRSEVRRRQTRRAADTTARRKQHYRDTAAGAPTLRVEEVERALVRLLLAGEVSGDFQPGAALDQLWDLIARTFAAVHAGPEAACGGQQGDGQGQEQSPGQLLPPDRPPLTPEAVARLLTGAN
jgi:hypothetical protein